MCGILFAMNLRQPVDRGAFDRARDTMAHRGPDANASTFLRGDTVALGHRRLSIIDLSAAGNQPMRLGDLWVVYNGEIYNYPDLKKELEARGCQFRTHCDTEVLLHGYRVWGEELPKHLAGMFAFCLWDDAKGELLAARDHAGQKPFHYFYDGQCFVAASESKAIFAVLGARPRMRREAIKDFLIYDDVPDPYTWYQNLMTLPPGHRLSLCLHKAARKPIVSEYWNYVPPARPRFTTRWAARERLGEILDRSVRMHQLADVEVGAFLSGGMDSSGVVALEARQRKEPVRTFSIGYAGDDGELPLARQVAAMWKCNHTEARLADEGLRLAFDRSLDLFDMPFGDTSQFPTYEVAALAAKQLKVVLTGDGGDEVFGGYWSLGKYMGRPPLDTSSLFEMLYGLKHRRELTIKWQSPHNFGHAVGDNETANHWLGPEFADLAGYDGLWHYKQHWRPELDPFRRAQWSDFKSYLPTVLKKVDRCTMAHALEARCPLLLPELVEFAFNLPTAVKNPRGEFKHLYRSWIRAKRLVPPALLDAPKQGFGISPRVTDRFQAGERVRQAMAHAQKQGWLSGAAIESASTNWGRSWRMALVGEALRRGMFS